MGTLFEEIRGELDRLPVISAHEHFWGHHDCQPLEKVTDYMLGAYMACMLRDTQLDISFDSQNDELNWNKYLEAWPQLKYTGHGQVIRKMLASWGVEEALTKSSYSTLRDRLANFSPEYSRQRFHDANIQGSVAHVVGHPNYGGIENFQDYFDGKRTFSEDVHSLMTTLVFHKFQNKAEIDLVGMIADHSISGIDDLRAAALTVLERGLEAGSIGFKEHGAYSRGLAIAPPDRSAAEKEFGRLVHGETLDEDENALSDYLFHELMGFAHDHDLPVALHTGYLAGGRVEAKANLMNFKSILDTYSSVRFDIFHLNFPYYDDFIAVMKSCPNAYGNCTWTHIVDPAGTENLLGQLLGTLPLNRIFAFGGDFFQLPDYSIAHLEVALDNMAAFLETAVHKKRISQADGLHIAKAWLYDNPKKFYGI